MQAKRGEVRPTIVLLGFGLAVVLVILGIQLAASSTWSQAAECVE
jgi:hypothetical protein